MSTAKLTVGFPAKNLKSLLCEAIVSWVSVSAIARYCALVSLLFLSGNFAAASENKEPIDGDDFVFVPPEIGAPKDRMGAGTRSTSSGIITGSLLLLVPESGGLTTLASPPLIWRLGGGHRGDLRISLKPVNASGTDLWIKGPFPPGDYGIDLDRSQLQLETGQIYEWKVQLLNQSSNKIVEQSVRLIERVPNRMRSHNPAASGLWFDALEPLVEIGLSGRVRVAKPDQFEQLMKSAGVGH